MWLFNYYTDIAEYINLKEINKLIENYYEEYRQV